MRVVYSGVMGMVWMRACTRESGRVGRRWNRDSEDKDKDSTHTILICLWTLVITIRRRSVLHVYFYRFISSIYVFDAVSTWIVW
jgi:hypothetical protein